jgi:transcriptional regulator with XRE-family HTH domain
MQSTKSKSNQDIKRTPATYVRSVTLWCALAIRRQLARYPKITNHQDGIAMATEGEDFSKRLQKALQDANYSLYGPTGLARQFNARFAGPPVSVHAARKWLIGKAIPTQDKIRTLAEWLVVPAEWLRFGGYDQNQNAVASPAQLAPHYARLIDDIQLLDSRDQRLIFDFIQLLRRSRNDEH